MTALPIPQTKAELAPHLRLHDQEEVDLGFKDGTGIEWHYEDARWWTWAELKDAHASDHEETPERCNHTHDGPLR